MPLDRGLMRYAHSDGHTDVCYSEDGQRLITCGTDGDIRIWTGFDDDDPIQTCVGEWSLCVRQKGNQLAVATDSNIVQLMTFPEAERDGILVRFTAPVNHMAIAKHLVVIGAEDMEIKVMEWSNPAESVSTFSGITGPPLSVALSSNTNFLAVSSGDGMLRIWDVKGSTLLKEIECVPKTNSFMNAKLLCRIDFEPITGRTLAYPSKSNVILMNTSDWSTKLILMCPEIESPYSIVQYSPCGKIIAAASQHGDIILWEVESQDVLAITKHLKSTAICAMVWNPSGNGEIAYCDVTGQLGIATFTKSVPQIGLISEASENNDVSDQISHSDNQSERSDDDDDENVVSLKKLKNDIMGTEEPELNFDNRSSRSSTPRPRTPEIPLQNVFMPSSTPEHLNPRYLCWNDIGVVRSYGNDTDEIDSAKSIEVEFHDTSLHNSIMMQNYQGYTMAALSSTALAVACTSQIAVIPLSSGSKEWNLSSPEEEEIICISCSQFLICFATNNYLIRICSVYGTQKTVLSIPGPIVSLSACGHNLLIAYHSSLPRKGDQCINVMHVKSEGMSIESKDLKSALRPETTLQWLGFTDCGTPAMQDSYGMLCLYPLNSNVWLPFCDTAKHSKNPCDGFFITGVSESLQSVRGIRCRGSVYPGFTPRPTLSELPLEAPFIEMTTEKSQLESSLYTWSTLRVDNVEKKIKETALKTFALACKNNLDQRALELIEMLANPQLVTLATKYATKMNRRRLSEKLMELASSMQTEWTDTTLNSIVPATPDETSKKFPINRKLILHSSNKRTSKTKVSIEQDTSSSPILRTSEVQDASANGTLNETVIKASVEDTTIQTQESLFSDSIPKNPFLKSLKVNETSQQNPLSLTDKFAGYSVETNKKAEKENKTNTVNKLQNSEKRKKPDEPSTDKPKGKIGKLDAFLFSKRS